MKKYILVLLILLTTPTLAANTTGHAWSESVGWFDFSNVTVTNTAVTGHAYNDNTGWLVLDGVVNTNGQLTGYAWSESVGYFNFASTTIQNGAFKGYAYNDNTGWLSFETGTTVATSWTPAVTPPSSSGGAYYGGGSSGGSSSGGWLSGSSSTIPLSLRTQTTQPQLNTSTSTDINFQIITAFLNGNRNLKQNTRSSDVKILQQFLNSQGFIVALTGPGSPGFESDFFGKLTKKALIKFQIKNNIKPSSGYFGPITRTFIKSMLKIN